MTRLLHLFILLKMKESGSQLATLNPIVHDTQKKIKLSNKNPSDIPAFLSDVHKMFTKIISQ